MQGSTEHIESMDAEEFIAGKTKVDKAVPTETVAEEDFLAKKLRCKEYGLSQHEVLILQSYGVNTIGDLLDKTESDFTFMKDKKGISYAARFSQVFEKVHNYYRGLFGVVKSE